MAPITTPWMGDCFSLTMRFLVGVRSSCGKSTQGRHHMELQCRASSGLAEPAGRAEGSTR